MKEAIFTIGRFNPPTIGHEELLKKVVAVSREKKVQIFVFTTTTIDSKKNPLDIGTKLQYLRQAFPGITFIPVNKLIDAFQFLNDEGVEHLVIVAGKDRANGYASTVQRGIDGGHVNFKSFDTISLERDPDSDEVQGASASKARKFAQAGDLKGFIRIAPTNLTDQQKEQLYHKVREGLKLNGE